jgi:hypothetical protein
MKALILLSAALAAITAKAESTYRCTNANAHPIKEFRIAIQKKEIPCRIGCSGTPHFEYVLTYLDDTNQYRVKDGLETSQGEFTDESGAHTRRTIFLGTSTRNPRFPIAEAYTVIESALVTGDSSKGGLYQAAIADEPEFDGVKPGDLDPKIIWQCNRI